LSPVIVHLVGAQESNRPWGFENRLMDVMAGLGIEVISTDFRLQRRDLPRLLAQKADLLLVCKGEWISPRLIRSVSCPTALWYAEFVGSDDDGADYATLKNRRVLAYNGPAFDHVFCHDGASLGVYRKLGCKSAAWLPTAAVCPQVHKKLSVPKECDVVFVGTQTPRRRQILAELGRHYAVYSPQVWDPVQLNELLNRSRIVLNIHASGVLNTETRLCEVLGAGSFLLSEQVSCPGMFEDGRHLVYWKQGQVDDLVAKVGYYLRHEDQREDIARSGHVYALEHHTLGKRVETLLSMVGLDRERVTSLDGLAAARRGTVDLSVCPPASDHHGRNKVTGFRRTIERAAAGARASLWALGELLKVRLQVVGLEKPPWLRRPRWLR
jgi:spore maturation protein CgeB